ncbi:MAG TPA: hypothetical protein VGB66_17980 [Longimicrobium sp.]|jgi:hypothetical protein
MNDSPEQGQFGEVIWRRVPYSVEVATDGDCARWFLVEDRFNGRHIPLLQQRFSPEDIPHLAANPPAFIAPELRISLPHPLDGTMLAPHEYARSVATLYANLFDAIWRWRTRD